MSIQQILPNNNLKYMNKYIKYKQKYLNLKYENNIGGAFNKIDGCKPIINEKVKITNLMSKTALTECINEHNKSANDEYFIILFLYENIPSKLDTNICDTLNQIIFNMDVKTENIFLLTQYVDMNPINIEYDKILTTDAINFNLGKLYYYFCPIPKTRQSLSVVVV